MKHMITAFYARPLASCLVAALLVISTLAGPAEAMHLPASPEVPQAAPVSDRALDVAKIQKILETKELQQRLLDYGLTTEEAAARIDTLSDEQLHRIASNLDSVQAGGDVLGFVLGLAIIALLVVLIIYLLEGRIEIKKT
jgi:hypothetical protein